MVCFVLNLLPNDFYGYMMLHYSPYILINALISDLYETEYIMWSKGLRNIILLQFKPLGSNDPYKTFNFRVALFLNSKPYFI